jgi:predicted nucleic acid-binding protein
LNGYLLDMSVLSALAPGRPEPSQRARDLIQEAGSRLFVPSMAVAEIARGIAKLRRNGATARADALAAWLDELERAYADHVLPFDGPVARLAGAMDDAATARGRHPGLADVIIAATAASHGLTVLSANGKHFAALEVPSVDPFA